MKTSEIISRARSLADIPNSKFIDNNDENQSLWESYKDIYSKLTDSSDDYFITRVDLPTSGATLLAPGEYELTVPADLYKIRFVDYLSSGLWVNMQKFNTNTRNSGNGAPAYRWRGTKLWISVGQSSTLPGTIRIDYYPAPVKPTVPEASKQYGTSYAPYDITKVQSKSFTIQNGIDYLIYIYNSVNIIVESLVSNTKTTLYTGTGLSNVVYYAGYIYYLASGNIYRAQTTLLAVITPAAIISTGTVTEFSIADNKVYYNQAGSAYTANLDGSSPTLLIAAKVYTVCKQGANIVNITAAFFLKIGAVTTAISATACASDGVDIFYFDATGIIHKITDYGLSTEKTIDFSTAATMTGGQIWNGFIPITNSLNEVFAISDITDTDLIYPTNEGYELLAYQCAIDFLRKAKGDFTAIQARYNEIMDRFIDQTKRDEYQTERRMPEWQRAYNW